MTQSTRTRLTELVCVAGVYAVVILICIVFLPAHALAASFEPLGEEFIVSGISGDGLVMAGRYVSAESHRWPVGGVPQGIGDIPGGNVFSIVGEINYDGTMMVGFSEYTRYLERDPFFGDYWHVDLDEAFVWMQSGGMDGLGFLPGAAKNESYAGDMSADGSVIVGGSSTAAGHRACRWTNGVIEGFGAAPDGRYPTSASAVSPDGSTVILTGNNFNYRWTAAGGIETLMLVNGDPLSGTVFDMTDDESVMIGDGPVPGFPWGPHAFRATSDGQREYIFGTIITGRRSYPIDMSADGSIVVGTAYYYEGGRSRVAMIWDEVNGSRLLQDVLQTGYDLDMTGWQLSEVTGISDDGTTLVGLGWNGDDEEESWIVTLDDVKGVSFPYPDLDDVCPPRASVGDLNCDAVVGLLDLDILGKNYDGPGGAVEGDLTGDGYVDLLDLDRLGKLWGRETVVPEPTVIVILVVGMFAGTRRR